MVDEIFDRSYRESRAALNAAIAGAFSRFGHAVGNAFRVLHRVEYSAPWTTSTPKVRTH